ncbi:MAG: alginate export family protein [Bacteroidales bacterium]|nr:alginate export family protein [Bacteroidales bacterium]
MKKLTLLLLAVVFAQLSFSQLTIDGEFRTRFEYRDGYKKMLLENQMPMSIIAQRSRINFAYNTSKIETRISLQDARIWGEDQWKTDNNGIGLHEAWAKYKFTRSIAIQAGRMELIYDDARLFANGDWRTYGQSHDVARLILFSKKHRLSIHMGAAINNNGTNANGGAYELETMNTAYDLNATQYKNLAYLWVNKKFMSNKLNVSLIGVRDGFQLMNDSVTVIDTIKYRITAGSFIEFKSGGLKLQAAYYMQTGENKQGKELNSNFYNAYASYKLGKSLNIGVGYDHYSGTDLNDNSQDNTFENLYGPGHKYLGNMDYFGIASKHKAGINDLFAKLNYKINSKNDIMIAYHMFSLDQEYISFKENAITTLKQVDKKLGSEIDLVYTYKATKDVNFKVGVSTLLYTESMELLKGVEAGKGMPAQFAWVQMLIKPNFFKSGSSQASSNVAVPERDRPVIKPNRKEEKK